MRQPGTVLEESDRAELVRTIDVEADRLSRLVTNLLDMTRVQAGALSVRAQPLSVADLVEETLSSLAPVLEGRTVTVSVPKDLPLVRVDHVLVGQALANLLENAARHSPAGTAVRIGAEPGAWGTVVVTVEDDGPGLPHRAEDPFAPFGADGPARGTGVGLSIAKAFVEAHGQRIWVEEAGSGGARIRFSLPALDEEHSR
jgi:two-component system sensor histidine kinase KdpD